ncbi:MAG: bifunctional hydroxymethylpyrimidine kinase/phosphomethylpyrimidine kinase [Verrucomicrobiota bacterium]
MRKKANQSNRHAPPVVLTIAGSDCSGGAGLQADLKTFTALGAYGCSAVTCVVAENPGTCGSITPVPAPRVREQIELVLDAYPVAAIKTGMLYSAAIVRTVAAVLRERAPGLPLVVDPVMLASTGDSLLKENAKEVVQKRLLPLATLVTPNREELRWLAGMKLAGEEACGAFGRELASHYGGAFLLKSVVTDQRGAVDLLCTAEKTVGLRHAWMKDLSLHGTGCTLASAIAARLAHGDDLLGAVRAGKDFFVRAMRRAHRLGRFRVLNYLE